MNNDRTDANEWPERPASWPEIITETELAMILRLDEGRSIESAKRSVRFIRRTQGLPDLGRVGRQVLFRRDAVFEWLAARERVRGTGSSEGGVASSGSADPPGPEPDDADENAPDGPSADLTGRQAAPAAAGDSISHLSENGSRLGK